MNRNTDDFSNQAAVVTGGCNGIGAAVAQRISCSGCEFRRHLSLLQISDSRDDWT
ncbi:MAG: hypothetical protein KTR35_15400 [Gammaproteobacteria bacterium]|nr:hypothetical protein [Gammaproteobacteria bacterium]